MKVTLEGREFEVPPPRVAGDEQLLELIEAWDRACLPREWAEYAAVQAGETLPGSEPERAVLFARYWPAEGKLAAAGFAALAERLVRAALEREGVSPRLAEGERTPGFLLEVNLLVDGLRGKTLGKSAARASPGR
jgi:hypothetical protein